MWEYILDILYPELCLACHKSNVSLCERCVCQFPEAPWQEGGIRARFAYGDKKVRRAIKALKYKRTKIIAPILGKHLADLVLEDMADTALFQSTDTIMAYVPLSSRRLAERGFNQAELLASEVAKIICLPVCHALIKTRHTESQTSLGRAGRLANIIGVFSVTNQTLIANKDIILIDDVYTTGATLSELRKIILEGGARSVRPYTLAH